MNNRKWLLLGTSVLYVLPFWYDTFWWMIVPFCVLFFLYVLEHAVSFFDGYMWGTISFFLHMIGILFGIARMSSKPLLFCALPFLFCVLYQGLYAGIWFWCTSFLKKKLHLPSSSITLAYIWIIGMWLYFIYIEQLCLICFGAWEGYMLMSPLLPLMQHPGLLWWITFIGTSGVSFFFYLWSATAALYILHRDNRMLLLLAALTIPWLLSYFNAYTYKTPKPFWLDRIVHVPKVFSCTTSSHMTARTVAEEIRQLLVRFPNADIVITPESAVLDPAIFSTPEYAYLFSQHIMPKPIHLIVGSFYQDDLHYYNSCYWLYNGILQKRYNKRHAMPLTERIPLAYNFAALRTLYFNNSSQVECSKNTRCCFSFSSDNKCVPYICSELFFNTWPDADTFSAPIIVMVNDRWCPAVYIKRLLYNAARFKAIQWQRDIIYVSFYYAAWLDRYGHIYPLQSSK